MATDTAELKKGSSASIVIQMLFIGMVETEYTAKGLASVIYLYRIEVIGKGNIPIYSDMKKCILIK